MKGMKFVFAVMIALCVFAISSEAQAQCVGGGFGGGYGGYGYGGGFGGGYVATPVVVARPVVVAQPAYYGRSFTSYGYSPRYYGYGSPVFRGYSPYGGGFGYGSGFGYGRGFYGRGSGVYIGFGF